MPVPNSPTDISSQQLARQIVRVLDGELLRCGVSLEAIAAYVQVSPTAIASELAGDSPMPFSHFVGICDKLKLKFSAPVRTAERQLGLKPGDVAVGVAT